MGMNAILFGSSLALLLLVSCSIVSYNFGKNQLIREEISAVKQEFFQKFNEEAFTMKNDLFDELTREIDIRCSQDDFASKISKDVMRKVKKEIQAMYSDTAKKTTALSTSTSSLSEFHQNEQFISRPRSKSIHSDIAFDTADSRPLKPDKSHDKPGQKNEFSGQTMISRLLNVENPVTACNETLFRLDIQLDAWPDENSWSLTNEQTNIVVADESYGSEDQRLFVTHEVCLTPGPYVFSLLDSWGDGILCSNPISCYNITIDNEEVFIGHELGTEITHRFDTTSICTFHSEFLLQFANGYNESNVNWTLHEVSSNAFFSFESMPDKNSDNFTNSYVTCLPRGSQYELNIFGLDENEVSCGDSQECYHVSVENTVIVKGSSFSPSNSHRISILISGKSLENQCYKHPLLSPVNHVNNFQYDHRVETLMGILHSVSSEESFDDYDSPQYKAACWILYDDILEIPAENEFTMQRYIMAVLLFSLNQNTEMMIPPNTCDMGRISCNDQGHVTKLSFRDGGLQGNIPSEISYLYWLESLDFYGNQLEGTLPSELGRLRNLNKFDIGENKLITGTIPTEFGELSNLRILQLGVSGLQGTIPSELGKLSKLELLYLMQNNLQGTIPSELFNCKALQRIYMDVNELTGSIPSNIHQLQDLEEIWLNVNKLDGSIPSEIGTLSSLNKIVLWENKLTGPIPTEIGNMKNLKDLSLATNSLTGPIPEEVGNLELVEQFGFSNNLLTGTIPAVLGNLTNLIGVGSENNKLSGLIPESFWENSYEWLILENNDLVGTVPDEFCENITFFTVDNFPWYNDIKVHCPCCGKVSECFVWDPDIAVVYGTVRPPCPIRNLHTFEYLRNNWVTDRTTNITKGFDTALGFWFDQNVCLSPTGCYEINFGMAKDVFTGDINYDSYELSYSDTSMSLIKQPQCDTINICGTSIDPSHRKRPMVNHITQLAISDMSLLNDQSSLSYRALCWIVTSDTKWDEYEICDGTLLQRYVMALFYLSQENTFTFETFSNDHTCEWPGLTCDSNNKYIQEINLPRINLQGSLISEIGLLQRLERIDLSSNSLAGDPVKEVEFLFNLKYLDLSSNKLDGTIDPLMFHNLQNMETFDVSNNQLAGEIPIEIFQLPRLNNIKFANNLLVGTLSNEITYSTSLEHLDLSNNLLQGTVAEAIFKCKKLKHVDVSQNGLDGLIPPSIGDLSEVKTIDLSQNRLSGNIPAQLFKAKGIHRLSLQSNKLTGSIPMEVANLQNATILKLDHNSLKGVIPTQLSTLKQLEYLHLHSNRLTGKAPHVQFVNVTKNSFITDCGDPSFIFGGAVKCIGCTMCCNSEDVCQDRDIFKLPMWSTTLLVATIVPIGMVIITLFLSMITKGFNYKNLLRKRDPDQLYHGDSVYCFFLSNDILSWLLCLLAIWLQIWLFVGYLEAAQVRSEESDFRYTFRCEVFTNECDDVGRVNRAGWALFFVVVLLHLGNDFSMSVIQIWNAMSPFDIKLLLSGVNILMLTLLATYTSFMYNFALAEKNSDLVTNAVILLFINDLDEHVLDLLTTVAPSWVGRVSNQISESMQAKHGEPNQQHKNDQADLYPVENNEVEDTSSSDPYYPK